MKNIKVVFISDADDKYGAPKALLEMITTLRLNYNVEPIVFTCSKSKINIECDNQGIENYCTYHRSCMVDNYNRSFKKNVKDIFRFVRYCVCKKISVYFAEKYIDFNSIDIIHSNSNRVDLGIILSEKYNIPHIMHFREEAGGCKPFNKNALAMINHISTKLIAISNIVKQGWVDYGLDKDKFTVIYDGIDIDDIDPKKFVGTNGKFKIVCVGSLFENKGQHIIMKAIHSLPPDIRHNIIFDIYGEGEYKKELEKLKSDLCLNNVFFKGYCDNIHKILQKYDCGVVASKKEGFGRTTVEYMSALLCVIAAKSGATQEIVVDEYNALMFNRDNYTHLPQFLALLQI